MQRERLLLISYPAFRMRKQIERLEKDHNTFFNAYAANKEQSVGFSDDIDVCIVCRFRDSQEAGVDAVMNYLNALLVEACLDILLFNGRAYCNKRSPCQLGNRADQPLFQPECAQMRLFGLWRTRI